MQCIACGSILIDSPIMNIESPIFISQCMTVPSGAAIFIFSSAPKTFL